MLLFIISFLLIFISSYFLTSIIAPKKHSLGLIYLFIIAFAQIVLTFEFLSLFSAIKEVWVLTINSIFLVIIGYIWSRKNCPVWSLNYADFKNKFINSLKLDKSLMWLYFGFCTLILSAVILCFLLPTTSADAKAYHVARSIFWVLQGSLNHFEVADIRNLCLPINSEILYSWVFLLTKKDVFLGFFSFTGFILSIVAIYNILGFMGYCTRKRLWTIFILSSFASVIVQISGNETDIIIAGLVLSSIFAFWYGLKNNSKIPIFMASLAYALAIGTKTTALIAMPGVGLFLIALSIYLKKPKYFLYFLGFGLFNFLIFSSYNYILNYLHFGNLLGAKSFMIVSKNYYGFKGAIANFIKYIFLMFDFTGFKWGYYITPFMTNARDSVLVYLHLSSVKDGLYTTPYAANYFMLEPIMGAGVLGVFVFLPCILAALFKAIIRKKSRKVWFMFTFTLLFIVNLCSISSLIAYMSYSARFIMFFMVISSPVLIYSYFSNKNPLKYIIVIFAMFYLIFVSNYLWPRPLCKISRILIKHPSISYLRQRVECQDYQPAPQYKEPSCMLRKSIQKHITTKNHILAFISTSADIYFIKMLEFEGYNIDMRTMEDIKNIDLNQYNVIISSNKGQTSTVVKYYESRKNECRISKNKIIINDNNPVPCIYMQNVNLRGLKNKETKYPFQVRCGMTKKFVDGKLHLIGKSGVEDPRVAEYDYYTMYAIKGRPLYLKK